MGVPKQQLAPVPMPDRSLRRLNSWKEVASYLDTSVRTVQRWERTEHLPVHRHEHANGGTVFAFTAELDDWLTARAGPVEAPASPPVVGSTSRLRFSLALAALLAIILATSHNSPTRHVAPVSSLAVLPFLCESGDADTDYLGEGLPESITRGLSRLAGFHVKVISHDAAVRVRGRSRTAQEAGHLLRADAVLIGKVTLRQERLIVSVELVNVRDNTQIWSERFERVLADMQPLQEQVAREIAARLQLRLNEPLRASRQPAPATSAEAHRNYLRGRYHWNRRTEGGLNLAIGYFQKAIAEDPAYAPAYAGLAESYALLSYYAPVPPKDSAPKALAAARRALELDASLSEAWNALAQVESDFGWEWAAAEQHFRKALELDDNNANAHHWFSEFLAAFGRFKEQRHELARAAELDPLSPIIANNQGRVDYFCRRFDDAAAIHQRAKTEYAHLANPRQDLGKVYLAMGRHQEAIAAFTEGRALGSSHLNGGFLAMAYASAGDPAHARKLRQTLLAPAPGAYVSPLAMGFISIGLGETVHALDYLEKALEERSPTLKWIGVDPLFDPLRNEPRFQAMLQRMGLPAVPPAACPAGN